MGAGVQSPRVMEDQNLQSLLLSLAVRSLPEEALLITRSTRSAASGRTRLGYSSVRHWHRS